MGGVLGRQAAGCGKGMEAIAGEFVSCDIAADVAARCGIHQQVSDHVTKPPPSSINLLVAMQER